MSILLRDDFINGVKKDAYGYMMDYEKYQTENIKHPEIFEMGQGEGMFEKNTTVIGMGDLVKRNPGERITYDRAGEGWTVQSDWDLYSKGIEFDHVALDDLSETKMQNMIMKMVQSGTQNYYLGKERLAANVFNYGGYTAGHDIYNGSVPGETDPSGDLVYDGKPFFNLSNNLRALTPTGTEAYYNAIAKPLTEANIQEAYDRMVLTNAVDARGNEVILEPDILLVHPSLRWEAEVLMNTTAQVGSANNDNNSVRGLLKVVPWRFLNTSTFWAIGSSKQGIKFWERWGLTFDFFRDNETKSYKATLEARYGIEVNDFRYWVASNAPTS